MLVAWKVPYETVQISYCFNVDFKHLLSGRNMLPDIIEFRVYLSNDAWTLNALFCNVLSILRRRVHI